ncbi:MAG: hypothetical protein EZS28_028256 [Streblomastix strix]|uniref:Uncharacterized protein n=1 Tax=Streblomastix strix TaxID=222440 RepID=A0A5J4V2E2_9EUKA|nr:MAG: hypothetical protein EZS28_028256 [Streblomastix strix]
MNQAQALKNLMENGTSIEYFNDGYIMKAKDKIKVYEEGKKSAKTLTQAQQTKLLLQARGGGQTKPKRATKRQVESDFDEEEDESSLNDRKFQSSEQLYSDEAAQARRQIGNDSDEEISIEKPAKTPKPTSKKTIKKPQINYTSPQVDLEELIRLRTENAFIKQQHQDSIKQVEKYKEKIKIFKQKKAEEATRQPQTPPQEQVPEPQAEEIPEIRFNETDLW